MKPVALRHIGFGAALSLVLSGCLVRYSEVPQEDRPYASLVDEPAPVVHSATRATGEPRGTLGIGHIVQLRDGTSASFDAYDYFARHPVGSLQTVLVDHPSEAEFVLSGHVESEEVYEYDRHDGLAMGAVTTGALGGVFTATGVTLVVIGNQPGTEGDALGKVGTGLSVVGGLGIATSVILGIAVGVQEENHYTFAHEGHFVLRRAGKKLAALDVSTSGEIHTDEPLGSLNQALTEPLWVELEEKMEQAISGDW